VNVPSVPGLCRQHEKLFDLSGFPTADMAPGSTSMYFGDIYSGGRHWATNQWYGSAATTMYLLADWLGGLRMWKDQSGNTDLTCENFPFGDGKTCQGGFSTTWGVFGDENDSEDNTYHTDARQHSPTQGRWLTPDPAGLAAMDLTNPQTWNRYAYVTNNPVSMTDPTGLDDEGGGSGTSGGEDVGGPGGLGSASDTPCPYNTCADVTATFLNFFVPMIQTSSSIGGFQVPGETVNVTATMPPDAPNNGEPPSTCLAANIAAVNQVSNLNVNMSNVVGQPFIYNGGLDVNFSVPGGSPPQLPVGRYPSSILGRIFGFGSSLHVPGPGGADPSTYGVDANGNFTFTTHIDSAYATWHTPIGALIHFFTDVGGQGAHRKPC
jgi:RHS repeat-associated protein